MNKRGGWLSFDLAAEEVERRLGVTWGAAQKTILDWCELGSLTYENVEMGGPRVSWNDLVRCLERNPTQKPGGKQPRIIALLEKIYPDGVPEPALHPRKTLKAQLCDADNSLRPLDEATLKRAIDTYNDGLRSRRSSSPD